MHFEGSPLISEPPCCQVGQGNFRPPAKLTADILSSDWKLELIIRIHSSGRCYFKRIKHRDVRAVSSVLPFLHFISKFAVNP